MIIPLEHDDHVSISSSSPSSCSDAASHSVTAGCSVATVTSFNIVRWIVWIDFRFQFIVSFLWADLNTCQQKKKQRKILCI